MSEPPRNLPTPQEQQAEYEKRKAAFDIAHAEWEERGRVGPRPPHPVRPHTPGWLPPKMPETADDIIHETARGGPIEMQASEVIDRAEQEIRAISNGDRQWRMHIPTRLDDSDVVLSLLVVVARTALADRERLTQERGTVRSLLRDWLADVDSVVNEYTGPLTTPTDKLYGYARSLAQIPVRIDSSVKPGEVHFVQRGETVGKIVNLQAPP